MKKNLLLLTLLALLALPAFALAEDWDAFVNRAHAAMADQEGEVVVEVSDPVTLGVGEAPLLAPDNVRLTIQGGQFDGLLLGRGEVVLAGVTVTGLPDADAIRFLPQGKEGLVRLTIGEDSTVAASGTGLGLTTGDGWTLGGVLEVRQLGQLSAESGACADLRMTGPGNSALRFDNAGSIRGQGPGVALSAEPEKGGAAVHLVNTGSILTAGDAARLTARSDKKGAYATLENLVGATIAQSEGTGAAVLLEATDTGGKGMGQGFLVNKGILRADADPLRLLLQAEKPVPVRVLQRGMVGLSSGSIPPVATVYASDASAGSPDAELREALAQLWASALTLDTLDTGAQLDMVFQDARGVEIERLSIADMGGQPEQAEMTWKEFRAWAEERLALSAGPELRLYVSAHVAMPQGRDSGRDKGLTVPAGKKLILEGGLYEQIMLLNGELELDAATVHATGKSLREAGPRSIYIPAEDNEIHIVLTIGEDSAVTATGENSLAITTDEKHKRPCSITIQNRGRIEGEEGVIDLSVAVVGERAVSLTLENTGKILSKGQAVSLHATTQDSPARLTIQNDGVIESVGSNAVTLTGLSSRNSAFFLLRNGPEGNLRCSTGNALTVRTWDPAAPATNPRPRVAELEASWGSLIIENQGKIGGLTAPIRVESLLRALFPVEVGGPGTIHASGTEDGLELTVIHFAEKADRAVTQEEYDQVVRAHIKEAYRMPQDLRARMRLRVPANAQIPEDLTMYEADFK